MKVSHPLRFAVYLTYHRVTDRSGVRHVFPERRLVRQTGDDRVIGVVSAPPGSRVRHRRDRHGADQLVVPIGRWPWARLFGARVVIPTKYLLDEARRRRYGLALVPSREAVEAPG